eukprot:TRINITY_DN9717_c1_g1_i1.p1 TRINITY_DN9717_c1_g1~~TRINITY_DN9717_c1_g1_i1.p1  ORF type:complete len:1029 (+),score=209.74 TRINITY_DN9717_c1_g1_i1:83-3088(+)
MSLDSTVSRQSLEEAQSAARAAREAMRGLAATGARRDADMIRLEERLRTTERLAAQHLGRVSQLEVELERLRDAARPPQQPELLSPTRPPPPGGAAAAADREEMLCELEWLRAELELERAGRDGDRHELSAAVAARREAECAARADRAARDEAQSELRAALTARQEAEDLVRAALQEAAAAARELHARRERDCASGLEVEVPVDRVIVLEQLVEVCVPVEHVIELEVERVVTKELIAESLVETVVESIVEIPAAPAVAEQLVELGPEERVVESLVPTPLEVVKEVPVEQLVEVEKPVAIVKEVPVDREVVVEALVETDAVLPSEPSAPDAACPVDLRTEAPTPRHRPQRIIRGPLRDRAAGRYVSGPDQGDSDPSAPGAWGAPQPAAAAAGAAASEHHSSGAPGPAPPPTEESAARARSSAAPAESAAGAGSSAAAPVASPPLSEPPPLRPAPAPPPPLAPAEHWPALPSQMPGPFAAAPSGHSGPLPCLQPRRSGSSLQQQQPSVSSVGSELPQVWTDPQHAPSRSAPPTSGPAWQQQQQQSEAAVSPPRSEPPPHRSSPCPPPLYASAACSAAPCASVPCSGESPGAEQGSRGTALGRPGTHSQPASSVASCREPDAAPAEGRSAAPSSKGPRSSSRRVVVHCSEAPDEERAPAPRLSGAALSCSRPPSPQQSPPLSPLGPLQVPPTTPATLPPMGASKRPTGADNFAEAACAASGRSELLVNSWVPPVAGVAPTPPPPLATSSASAASGSHDVLQLGSALPVSPTSAPPRSRAASRVQAPPPQLSRPHSTPPPAAPSQPPRPPPGPAQQAVSRQGSAATSWPQPGAGTPQHPASWAPPVCPASAASDACVPLGSTASAQDFARSAAQVKSRIAAAQSALLSSPVPATPPVTGNSWGPTRKESRGEAGQDQRRRPPLQVSQCGATVPSPPGAVAGVACPRGVAGGRATYGRRSSDSPDQFAFAALRPSTDYEVHFYAASGADVGNTVHFRTPPQSAVSP